uniref:Uncharacterized protein n=1 Tax=Arundo donax TaxID=35708 RepID=A0A0A9E0B2_ARUDO
MECDMQDDNISLSSSCFNIFDGVLVVFFLCVFAFSLRTMLPILKVITSELTCVSTEEDEIDKPSSSAAAFLESTCLFLDCSDPETLLCLASSFGPSAARSRRGTYPSIASEGPIQSSPAPATSFSLISTFLPSPSFFPSASRNPNPGPSPPPPSTSATTALSRSGGTP